MALTRCLRKTSLQFLCRRLQSYAQSESSWHGTTILSVRKDDQVAVVGDGQVTMGSVVVKPNARKVRRIGDDVVAGFSGTTADALTLFERLETKMEEHPGQLLRACVSLAKDWRTDRYLRKLDALLLVSDASISLTLTGNGDVLEPEGGVVGIGSGGPFAVAAARSLLQYSTLSAEEIAKNSMKIAADMCIYTNAEFIVETIDTRKGRIQSTNSRLKSSP
ncbi:hypothetical protein GpartN1_g83.t1 [Galdieria partita]|uniref:HslU--HslV peptidase n=1 Tax=Galdieria partita TaxID=83374 RepID=A0A9C7PR96_9RHOD|nr:hypothetical protein GpartN1_g83.t1 [Galdieria partita]